MAATGAVEQPQLGDHICAFVDGLDDRLDVMARSVTAGLDADHKVIVFTEALLPTAVRAGLEARGVCVQSAQRTGQVEILSARDEHRPTGGLAGHVDKATAAGHPLRLVADLAWARDEPAGLDHLVGYEAQLNQLHLDGRVLAVCLYDRQAFDLDRLRQVACAHPATCTSGDDGEADWVALLRIRRTSAPYGLRLSGEADLGNRQAVAAALEVVLDQQPDRAAPIVVDIAGLRFVDAGTAILLGRLTLRAPAGVHITGCHGTVATVLDGLGVHRLAKMRLTSTAGAATCGVGAENVA